MEARLSFLLASLSASRFGSLFASAGRRIGFGPALVGVLGVLAYRTLLQGVLATDYGMESWFFRPSQLPPLLVLAVAGWLLWRRREHGRQERRAARR